VSTSDPQSTKLSPSPGSAPLRPGFLETRLQVLARLSSLLKSSPAGEGPADTSGGLSEHATAALAASALEGFVADIATSWAISRDGTKMLRLGERGGAGLSGEEPEPTRTDRRDDTETGRDRSADWIAAGGPVADVLGARQAIEIGFPDESDAGFLSGARPNPTPNQAPSIPAATTGGPVTVRAVARFVPVRHRDRIVAVVGVLRRSPSPPFDGADRLLIDAVVERTEAALDLQDQRDAVAALQSSNIQRGSEVVIREELMTRLASIGGDVLFSHRFGVGTTYVSPGIERMLGYSPEDFTKDPTLARRVIHPDDRHLIVDLSEDPALFARPLTVRVITRDGEVAFFFVRLTPTMVGGRVIGAEGLATDISSLKQQEAELSHQARSDSLTGLANRLTFREFQARSLARIERHGGRVAVLYLDLSGFKRVNDTIGHAAGDKALGIVADRLRKVTRREDVVARLGGDEFTVLMPDVRDESEATATAQRIIAAIEEPMDIGSSRLSISTGIGIALTTDGTITPDELLNQADMALYSAKRQGPGRWAMHEGAAGNRVGPDQEPDLVPVKVATPSALRAALAAGDFRVHYSPVVDLTNGLVVAVEALARWQHPEVGLLFASEFLDAAEESEVIHSLGDWVLRQGCRQVRRWMTEHSWEVDLHLNVTPSQLANPDLAESVLMTLAAEGIAPRNLSLDVPERAITGLTPDIERTIETLHRAGVRISLDEFGTSASVKTLRRIPFSHIKLDRGLVEELDLERVGPGTDDNVISLAVRLGASLGATVGAVGVERPLQLSRLAALQCASIQGKITGGSVTGETISARINGGTVSYANELSAAGWVASFAATPLFTTAYPDPSRSENPPTDPPEPGK
jgi:diguanylate cyclase (GGDEF)-like protein/PAS domain S-box-containing protein